ncbi:MAG: alginate lyase family protein [Planctomycetes bacterium]|nr:alginate lyase family protein [Planctomycetota bacterium]
MELKDLFDFLDFQYPGLEGVRAAHESGDDRKAADLLLGYYQIHRSARCVSILDRMGQEAFPPMPWGAAPDASQLWKNTPENVAAGFLYSSGHLFDFSKPEGTEWRFDYSALTQGTSRDPYAQARLLLHRMCWLRALDLAYLHGSEALQERASHRFVSLIESWWSQPVDTHTGEWSLTAACRLGGNPLTISGLTFSWYTFLNSSSVPEGFKLRLFLDILRQAEAIQKRGPETRAWGLHIGCALGYVGMLFPECKSAKMWVRQCAEYVNGWIVAESREDGTYDTHDFCPHYQTAFCIPVVLAQHLSQLGCPDLLEPAARKALERSIHWLVNVQKPDHTLPQINASDIQGCTPWLRTAAKFFDRPDWLYVLSAGEEGTLPGHTSILLPNAGAFILRDGFKRESMVACFHNGNGLGCKERSSLAIDLYAFGRTLVTGCGRYGYYKPEWYHYFINAGYNTLMVDDSFQQEWGVATPIQRSPGLQKNTWHFSPDVDFAWGTHPAGFDNAPDVRHQRGLLFAKSHYWLVIDAVQGSGQHGFSLRWLLTPSRVVIQSDGLGVHTQNDDANVRILPFLPQAAHLRIWEGSREPLRGWFSPENGTMIPAPQLEYTWQAELPLIVATLFVPYRKRVPGLVAQISNAPDGRTTVTVKFKGHVDRLTIGLQQGGSAQWSRDGREGNLALDLLRDVEAPSLE